jgi:hypothetical protein
MGRLLIPAATAAALLAFAPWAHVSIAILGANSPFFNVKGTEIGSGLGFSLAAGWVAALLAAAVVVRYATGHRPVASAVVLVLFALYSVATLSHHTVSVSGSGGLNVSDLGARVTIAWGAWAELVTAVIVLVAACSVPDRSSARDDEANEYVLRD